MYQKCNFNYTECYFENMPISNSRDFWFHDSE